MDFKLIGCILMVVGTSIGAAMLALPIATAQLGFLGSVILFVVCWAVMLCGALLLLEVNLWLPQRSHFVSMAGLTIGPIGQIVAWLTYMLLLYSLLSAYIDGGSDLFRHILSGMRVNLSPSLSAFLFTIVFGSIVWMGVRSVDYVNRGLMIFKFLSYFILLFLLSSFVSPALLSSHNFSQMTLGTAITVTITSFGFGSIIPSIRIYYAGNIKKLKQTIIIGSLIPLVIYTFWAALIMGIIPLGGEHGLLAILRSDDSVGFLVRALDNLTSSHLVTLFTKFFTSICVLTSFLGVALSLVDFLADGFQLEKKGMSSCFLHLTAFVPPLIIVLYSPGIFISALQYAGIYCAILLVVMPAIMAWRGRYHRKLHNGFRVLGGRPLLFLVATAGLFIITRGLGF